MSTFKHTSLVSQMTFSLKLDNMSSFCRYFHVCRVWRLTYARIMEAENQHTGSPAGQTLSGHHAGARSATHFCLQSHPDDDDNNNNSYTHTRFNTSESITPVPVVLGEDVWLYGVWESVQALLHPLHSSAHTLGHAALPLPVLWQTVPPEVRHEETHFHTHWWVHWLFSKGCHHMTFIELNPSFPFSYQHSAYCWHWTRCRLVTSPDQEIVPSIT